MKQGRTL